MVSRAEQLYAGYVASGVRAVLGWAGDDTDALRPRVTADKVPYLSAAYAESLADPAAAPYNFFPGPSYSQQMRIVLAWIADQSKGKGRVEVAVFHHDSAFGTGPVDDARAYVAAKRLDVGLKAYPMPARATDYLAQVGQARTQGARYVVVQNTAKAAAQLARDLAAQKSTAQVVCLNWCADELFVKLAGPAGERLVGVMPFPPAGPDTPALGEINAFLASKSTDFAAGGVHYLKGWYTAAALGEGIANALNTAGDRIDGAAIKAGLEKISELRTGPSTAISFSPDNHAGMRAAPLYRVENGAFTKLTEPLSAER